MSDLSHDRGNGCVTIMSAISALYRSFAKRFPEAKDFWSNLSMEEENHAAILTIASGYKKFNKLSGPSPLRSQSQIRETLELLATAREKIEGKNISLKEAVEIALQLEIATREYHLIEVTAEETDPVILAQLQGLAIDHEWHLQKIHSFSRARLSSFSYSGRNAFG